MVQPPGPTAPAVHGGQGGPCVCVCPPLPPGVGQPSFGPACARVFAHPVVCAAWRTPVQRCAHVHVSMPGVQKCMGTCMQIHVCAR